VAMMVIDVHAPMPRESASRSGTVCPVSISTSLTVVPFSEPGSMTAHVPSGCAMRMACSRETPQRDRTLRAVIGERPIVGPDGGRCHDRCVVGTASADDVIVDHGQVVAYRQPSWYIVAKQDRTV
jgi:hypothetical protein